MHGTVQNIVVLRKHLIVDLMNRVSSQVFTITFPVVSKKPAQHYKFIKITRHKVDCNQRLGWQSEAVFTGPLH